MLDLKAFQDLLNMEKGFNFRNHIRFTVLEEGYCECEVELTEDSLNPQGVAHGSLLFALCDCVTGAATASTNRGMLTQSATIHYLRPGSGKKLYAKSRLLRNGRTTALCLGEVYDEEGRLVVTSEFEVFYTSDELTLPTGDQDVEETAGDIQD